MQASVRQSAVDLKTAIQVVAKETIPAVVHIEVTQRQEVTNPFLPFENDPFFRYFFNGPRMPRKFKRELKGLGTGMIMDAEGHILTNTNFEETVPLMEQSFAKLGFKWTDVKVILGSHAHGALTPIRSCRGACS